jgi:hypothetical protein
MNRKEAIALLRELGANQLVNPNLVLLEQREPDRYRLQIRGDYNRQLIIVFLKKRGLSFEQMNSDYLIIFKPKEN